MEKIKAQSQLFHELQLFYQICDREGKGELEITEISHLVISFAAANGIILASDDAYQVMQKMDKSQTGKVSWNDFSETLEKWTKDTGTHELIMDRIECNIPLSPQERIALHKIFGAFFINFHQDMSQFVSENQLEMTYLEDSLGKIAVDGTFSSFTPSEKQEKLHEASALCIDFSYIVQTLASTNTMIIANGVQQLAKLLDIFWYFPSLAERLSILRELDKIMDLILKENLISRLYTLLNEMESVLMLSATKVEILQIFASLSNYLELIKYDSPVVVKNRIQRIGEFISSPLIAETLFKSATSMDEAIRAQALYTLGMFAANKIGSLAKVLFADGGINYLIDQVSWAAQAIPMPEKIYTLLNWTLCIVFKNYLTVVKPQIKFEQIASNLALAAMTQKNIRVLSIAVLTLSYLLPYCSCTVEIKRILNDILNLLPTDLSMKNPELQSSCLITLRRTILYNRTLCLEMLNGSLAPKLLKFLVVNGVPPDNKLECLGIIDTLVLNEGHANFLNNGLINVLFFLYTENKLYQWDIIRIFSKLTTINDLVIESLEKEIYRLVEIVMVQFKYVDNALTKAYGPILSVYNFHGLNDCIKILQNMLIKSFHSTRMVQGPLLFDYTIIDKIVEILDTLIVDVIAHPHKYIYSLAKNSNVLNNLHEFVWSLRDLYIKFSGEASREIIYSLDIILNKFEAFKISGPRSNNYLGVMPAIPLDVKLFFNSSLFNDSKEHLLQVPMHINLTGLLIQIQERYGIKPDVIKYWDGISEGITINNDIDLDKAKLAVVRQAQISGNYTLNLSVTLDSLALREAFISNVYQCPNCGQSFNVEGGDQMLIPCPKCNEPLAKTKPLLLF